MRAVKVVPPVKRVNAKLLPELQNQFILIPSGSTLRLLCALTHSNDNSINWKFSPRLSSSYGNFTTLYTPKSNELKILKTNFEKNEGIYQCWSDSEYQVKKIF